LARGGEVAAAVGKKKPLLLLADFVRLVRAKGGHTSAGIRTRGVGIVGPADVGRARP